MTKLPLISTGEDSDKYIGTTIAAIPTPNYFFNFIKYLTPTINLPIMRTGIVGATPIMIAPMVKRKSEAIIVNFLPNLSAIGPPKREPMAAPRVARETMSCRG